MYISNLKIRNWRNFTKADINFMETVYIIGPNASGKSNLLDIFRFMRDIANPNGGGLQQAFSSRGGLSKVRSLEVRKQPQIRLEFEFTESLSSISENPEWKYVLWIKNQVGRAKPIVLKEEAYKNGNLLFSRPDASDKSDTERLTQTHLEQINVNKQFRDIALFFEKVNYLHMVPQLLKFKDQFPVPYHESDSFGQGFLEEISKTPKRKREFRLKKIEEILLKVIPDLGQMRFVNDDTTGQPHLEMTFKHWRPNAGWLREDQFSDGTLRLIAIMWTLLSSSNMILLEEPELSLHTKIVEQIPYMICKIRQSQKNHGGQILISTHSETMLQSKSIDGNFLMLKPGDAGKATVVVPPSEDDKKAMRAGLSPADVLLPQTSTTIQRM